MARSARPARPAFDDIGDELSRLGSWLLDQRTAYEELILSGECTPELYLAYCMRRQQIEDTLEQIEKIRRGTDRQRPRERLPSVEC